MRAKNRRSLIAAGSCRQGKLHVGRLLDGPNLELSSAVESFIGDRTLVLECDDRFADAKIDLGFVPYAYSANVGRPMRS